VSNRESIGKCIRRVDWWRYRWHHMKMIVMCVAFRAVSPVAVAAAAAKQRRWTATDEFLEGRCSQLVNHTATSPSSQCSDTAESSPSLVARLHRLTSADQCNRSVSMDQLSSTTDWSAAQGPAFNSITQHCYMLPIYRCFYTLCVVYHLINASGGEWYCDTSSVSLS